MLTCNLFEHSKFVFSLVNLGGEKVYKGEDKTSALRRYMSFFSVSGWLNIIPEVFSAFLKSSSNDNAKKRRRKKSESPKLVYANSDSRIFEPKPVTIP